MKLTVLGSGVMVPTKERFPAAYLLEHEGNKILLDCGHLVLARLVEYGIDPQTIDVITISHFHTDHFGGFLPFLHARKVSDFYHKRESRQLVAIGPETLEDRYKKLREVMWPEPKEDYPISFFKQPIFKIGDMEITSFSVKHVNWFPSLGFRFATPNRSLVYTGDMNSDQDEETYDYFRDVDYLLVEAGSGSRGSATHLNVEESFEVGKKYGVKKILLTHLREDLMGDVTDFQKAHGDCIEVLSDGMVVEI